MLGLAILCQLGALAFAPLIVVQPLGALALVITTLLNSRVSGHKPTKKSIRAIIACVGGIFIFVTIAAFVATEQKVTDQQLITILLLLAGRDRRLQRSCGSGCASARRRSSTSSPSGVIYGFVATLAKVVIKRVQAGNFEWLTLLCLIALLAAVAVGAYFVQTAYSVGPARPRDRRAHRHRPDGRRAHRPDRAARGRDRAAGPLWSASRSPARSRSTASSRSRATIRRSSATARSSPIERGSAGAERRAHPSTGSIRLTEAVAKVWPEPPVHDDETRRRSR